MEYTSEFFRCLFRGGFDAEVWTGLLSVFFGADKVRAVPESVDVRGVPGVKEGFYLGELDTSDGYRIGFFRYCTEGGGVSRRRVGLRRLVGSFVNPRWGCLMRLLRCSTGLTVGVCRLFVI